MLVASMPMPTASSAPSSTPDVPGAAMESGEGWTNAVGAGSPEPALGTSGDGVRVGAKGVISTSGPDASAPSDNGGTAGTGFAQALAASMSVQSAPPAAVTPTPSSASVNPAPSAAATLSQPAFASLLAPVLAGAVSALADGGAPPAPVSAEVQSPSTMESGGDGAPATQVQAAPPLTSPIQAVIQPATPPIGDFTAPAAQAQSQAQASPSTAFSPAALPAGAAQEITAQALACAPQPTGQTQAKPSPTGQTKFAPVQANQSGGSPAQVSQDQAGQGQGAIQAASAPVGDFAALGPSDMASADPAASPLAGSGQDQPAQSAPLSAGGAKTGTVGRSAGGAPSAGGASQTPAAGPALGAGTAITLAGSADAHASVAQAGAKTAGGNGDPAPQAGDNAPGSSATAAQPDASTLAVPLQAQTGAAGQAAQPRADAGTLSRLSAQIVQAVGGGKSSFDLTLHPDGLGDVQVKVSVDRNGAVTAHMTFSNPQAAADLGAQVGDLKQALAQAGFSVADNGLSFNLGGQGQSGAGQNAWSEGPPPVYGRAFQGALDSSEDLLASVNQAAIRLQNPSAAGLDIRI
jgi:Meckel syndrome type 1 protein